ncbi:MAG TPA: PAS domain-containing protein [Candidatus Sulfotelmatobacter sp.]|nr:PAS domain-containing protein [Candidatus Sulfotelmatobacter sp.]
MSTKQNFRNDAGRDEADRLSFVINSAGVGTWDWNIATGELQWSERSLELFGLHPGAKMTYERFIEALHPEDRERIDHAVKHTLETKGKYDVEMRAVWPDGSVHWVASRGQAYFDESGRAVRMSGIALDIGKAKETEEELDQARAEARAKAAEFSALVDAVPALAFFSQDSKCEYMTASHYAHDVFSMPYGINVSMSAPEGQKPNVVYYENGRELKPEELPMQQAAATGLVFRNKELEIRYPDGHSLYIFGNAVPLLDDAGKPRGAVGAFLDVTERKRIEEELRLANERFSISLRNTPITVFSQGTDLRYKWIYNPMGGHSADEILGKTDFDILDRREDAEMVREIKKEVLRTGNSYEGEMTVQIMGVPHTYHVNMEPQLDPQGHICGLTCASFELTERKRLDEERQRLGGQLRLALDAAQMGWWHFDAVRQISSWDDRTKNICGSSANSGDPDDLNKIIHPQDRERAWAAFQGAIDPKNPKPYDIEYRIVRPDGSERWVEAHGSPEFEGSGPQKKLLGVGGTLRDITDRKTAEEALREHQERFEFVAEGSDVGFWFCDLPFDKIIWDKRVKNHFWLPPDDSPVTLDIFYSRLHPDDREPTRRAIERSIQNNEQYDVEYRPIAPDGREKWIRAVGRTFYDESGRPKRFDGITVDITARKHAEQAQLASERRLRELAENLDREVQARTAELEARNLQIMHAALGLKELSGRLLQIQDEERRRVARDLHDSAGQIVTALDLELGSLAERVRKAAPQLQKTVESSQNLVQQLHREIRTTSYLLHPPLLDEAGLNSALSWYVQGLSQRSDIEIQLEIQEGFGRLPRDLELAIFRLVQESLTNIHRHSGSKTAEIRLARSAETVYVEIQDRGKGIAPEALKTILEGGSGVGICGMRERLRQFGAELQIESSERGTRVSVTIPITKGGVSENGVEAVRAVS